MTAQKELGGSQQNIPLTEMLEVGADEDMDIPPLEWVGEEQENNDNQDQNQRHTLASAPTTSNGVGEPGQDQQIDIPQDVHTDQIDSAQALWSLLQQRQERNKTEPGEELKYILGIMTYNNNEEITPNKEIRTWLSERMYVLSTQALTRKEKRIWEEIRKTCALELMDPPRTQESVVATSSSNESSLISEPDKSDDGCGVEVPDHWTDQEYTPEERRTRIGGGGHQELTGTETSVKPPRPTPKGLGKQVGFANQNQVLDDKKEKTPGNLQEGLGTKIAPGDALELQQHQLQMQVNGQNCSDVKHSRVGDSIIKSDNIPYECREKEEG